MIEGVGVAVIARPAADIVAFVTDLERYKQADTKIGRVFEQRREGNTIFMRHDGHLRGIPGPAVSLRLVVADDLSSVRYRGVPTFPSRFVLDFEGGFELSPVEGGTQVVHTERFSFFAPFSFVAEPLLRTWLQDNVRDEMVRLKQFIEA